jgi:protease-4
VHGQFVRAVAKGRGLPESKIRQLADGRVYSGEQAKRLGLVDHLGNMEDAIELAAKRGGIKGTPQVIYSWGREKSWWERLFLSAFGKQWAEVKTGGLRYEWSPSLLP